jgi:hypothetical protein
MTSSQRLRRCYGDTVDYSCDLRQPAAVYLTDPEVGANAGKYLLKKNPPPDPSVTKVREIREKETRENGNSPFLNEPGRF